MNHHNIAIDGRGALLYRGTGIGTYTRQLLAHLPKERSNFHILLPGMEYRNLTFSKNSDEEPKELWRNDFLPGYLRKNDITLYHVPQNGIGLPTEKVCKEVVTVHDLIPYLYPETVGRGYLRDFLREMPQIMERSDAVITVSECSARDIRRIFRYPREKLHVIYEAPEPFYRPIPKEKAAAFLEKSYGICGDYILYLGGFGIRKNVKALINGFYLLKKDTDFPLKLVLPGKRNRDFDALDILIDALGIREDVIFPDYIPVAELPCFYSGAMMMVYPSIYEGFGLPPLEAMACGTPVIAAGTSALPEILGDAALWCDPFDTVDIAEQIHRLWTSESLRREMQKKGREKAASYQWQKAAEETMKLWQSL